MIVEPFAVTVAAQVATIPVMAGTFGVIALAGPIANALVLPMLPVMIVTGGSGAVLSMFNPALGWLLLQITGLGTSAITTIAQVISSLPGTVIQVGNWPAAWSIAEAAGVITGLTVLALTSRRVPLRR